IEALNLIGEIHTWCDLAVFNALMDRAGGFQLLDYAESSYAPLQRAGTWVGRDERGHAAMGGTHLRNVLRTEGGHAQAQEWLKTGYRRAWDVFGRSNGKRQWRYIERGLKTKSNEQLRQEYIAEVTPLLAKMGLTPPDPLANRHFL